MTHLNKLFLAGCLIITALLVNSCNPFDDIYLKLAIDTRFDVQIINGTYSGTQSNICLSEFEDWEDNRDNIDEIKYISSAYITKDSTNGFGADSIKITVSRGDNSAKLFDYTIRDFEADRYVNNAVEIKLSQQEVDNINLYLADPKENKCFDASIEFYNGTPTGIFNIDSVIDILTEVKVTP